MTYLSSYVYLAFYHWTPWLFDSIIHESAEHTLFESVFYGSHFLGHVPVVTCLALYFTGVTVSVMGLATGTRVRSWIHPAVGLLLLLASSVVLSFVAFGSEDTLGFLLQQKQSVVRYEEGRACIRPETYCTPWVIRGGMQIHSFSYRVRSPQAATGETGLVPDRYFAGETIL